MTFTNSLPLRICSCIALGLLATSLQAQPDATEPSGVVIERAALTLKSPEAFKVSLKLTPVRTLPVVAPMDGVVQSVFVKISDNVKSQAELLRLDSEELSLRLKRAQAVHEVAKLELGQATDAQQKKLLEAKLEVTKRELDLAQFHADQTILRSAIDGQVTEVHVTKGQFVRAGDLLAKVIDPNHLQVDVPVERDLVDVTKPFPVTIEGTTTQAQVEALLPPFPEFDPLRELFVSVATARLTLESSDGKFVPGQSVFSEMIPRHPVAEIQSIAIKTADNDPEAERMVQVIRDGFVRSLPIQLLGQVGETHVFVSARFSPADELIISSSEELADGSWIRPMLLEEPEQPANRNRQQTAPRGARPF